MHQPKRQRRGSAIKMQAPYEAKRNGGKFEQ
jgi:hypothetical protein